MVAHNGLCLVHRAQLMTVGGAWPAAFDEAPPPGRALHRGSTQPAALWATPPTNGARSTAFGASSTQAEAAYRHATKLGREPQPGLALLRLAQGNAEAAAAAIRRAMSETVEPLKRAALLPAYVEILPLRFGITTPRAAACRELDEIAERQGTDLARSPEGPGPRARCSLAAGDALDALVELRGACRAWQELGAPHEAARARALLGLVCRTHWATRTPRPSSWMAARGVFQRASVPRLSSPWIDTLTRGPRRRRPPTA